MPLTMCLAAVSTYASALTVSINSTEINLPAPAGYQDVYNSDPQMQEIGDTFTASMNKMLAFFVPEGFELADGFNNYMLVQTPRGYEDRAFSASQFSQVRESTREIHARQEEFTVEAQREIDRIGRDASRRFGAEIRAQLGKTTPLGVFMDQPRAIGYTTLQKQHVEMDRMKRDLVQVQVTLTLHLNEKIVYLMLYRPLNEQSDIDVAQSTGRDWAEAIIAANVGAAGSDSGTSRVFTTLEVVLLTIVFLGGFGLFGWWIDNRRR